jgi:hypothetical protein
LKAISCSSTPSPSYWPAPPSKPPVSISTLAANGENAGLPDHPPDPPLNARGMIQDLRRWSDRAAKGDQDARQRLGQLLDRPEFCRQFFDLAKRVRAALTGKFAGDDWFFSQLLDREMGQLRAELLGPAPSAIERLLAERVAIGWLEVHTAEYSLALAASEYRSHWQKQVDHAHRRFLAALRLLTAVRRLPRPAVQVNIGEQQVNVSGG